MKHDVWNNRSASLSAWINRILLLQLSIAITTISARHVGVASTSSSTSSSLRFASSSSSSSFTQRQRLWCLMSERDVSLSSTSTSLSLSSSSSTSSSSSFSDILELRGGASPKRGGKKKGARTATLSSSASSKSATGAKKVGAAAATTTAGAASKAADKTGFFANALAKFPLTLTYMILVSLSTLLGLVLGEEGAHALLALDPIRVIRGWELWRPLTAAAYLGKPTISFVMNGYYLYQYGSSLERSYGGAQFLVFLLTEVIVLGVWSVLLGQPFFAQSIITAMLYVVSRSTPYQKANWIIFQVPYWSLPYALMVSDVLQTQKLISALPHLMGILAGHFYFFHKFVWPKKRGGGADWLAAPDFLVQRLDPNARTNKATAAASAAEIGKRTRKGRKLSDK